MAGRESPLWQRIALAATVALALVGMHHLTTSDCSEPVAHHAVVHVVEPGSSLDSWQGNPSSGDASVEDLTPGLVCLALLVAVGVVFRAVGGVLARRRDVVSASPNGRALWRLDGDGSVHRSLDRGNWSEVGRASRVEAFASADEVAYVATGTSIETLVATQ